MRRKLGENKDFLLSAIIFFLTNNKHKENLK